MGHRARRPILASLVLLAAQHAPPGSAEDANLEWLVVTSDRFSLAVEYPAALFHDPLMTYGEGDTVWFGPNKDGATVMISATIAGNQTPYQRVCMSGCPNQTDAVDNPTVGAVSGYIDDKVYYSKCMVADGRQAGAPKEMHCVHAIYLISTRATYDPVVAHIATTLK
jgi:hypothetical protein